jgi:N-acetylmuramoyl-L-alanine amidase
MGGNYYVLRNSPVPSILCEPSFISNPAIESKLMLAEKQRLEAEVYFISLVDYFSRGTPEIVELKPEGTVTEAQPEIRVAFSENSTIDLASVSVLLDDEVVDLSKIGPNLFSGFPQEALASGPHTLQASARSTGGNSSPLAEDDFIVDLEPEIVTLAATPEAVGSPYPQKIAALVLDANGNPVADSTRVGFSWTGGSTSGITLGGKASVFVGKEVPFGTLRLEVKCGGLKKAISLEQSEAGQYISGFILDAAGHPLEGATVTSGTVHRPGDAKAAGDMDSGIPGISAVSDELGFFVIMAPGGESFDEWSLEVSRRGYRRVIAASGSDSYPTIRLETFLKNLAPGTVLTLDAAGGGEETGWIGPTGVKASDLNLAVAERLAGLFRSAGIGVALTRDADQKVGPEQRVMAAEDANSTLLISISHRENEDGKVILGHFPGSSGGGRISGILAEEIEDISRYETEIAETADYLIQQTSCPAVKVVFPVGNSVSEELDLTETLNIWTRAYAIFCSALRYLGIEEGESFSVEGRVTTGREPVSGALLLIDGSLEMMADEDGRFSARLLERGNHVIEAYSGTKRSAPLTFDQNSRDLRLNLD